VTKARDPDNGAKAAGSKGKKAAEVICFVCGATGHYARDCEKRKGIGKALVASSAAVDEEEQQADEWDLALVTNEEMVFFSQHDILLDNEASINIFQNRDLLTG
jgi:Zinc knuckle